MQSGGYGEYFGLPEDQIKFLVNQQKDDMVLGVDEHGNPAMYKVGAHSIAASPNPAIKVPA